MRIFKEKVINEGVFNYYQRLYDDQTLQYRFK